MLGMEFGWRLRQSEGLLSSVLALMGLDLPVPDHTTLSRRARTWKPPTRSNDRQHVADGPVHVLVDSTGLKIYGPGQWLEEKNGAKFRRGWRKLHLAVDADSGEIIAHSLTNQETGDASQLRGASGCHLLPGGTRTTTPSGLAVCCRNRPLTPPRCRIGLAQYRTLSVGICALKSPREHGADFGAFCIFGVYFGEATG